MTSLQKFLASALDPTTAAAIEAAALGWGIRPIDILTRCRKAKFVAPRYAAMTVLRRHGMTLDTIAAAFGYDHSTVTHATRTTEHNLKYAADREDLAALIRKIESAVQNAQVVRTDTHCNGYVADKRVVCYLLEMRGTDLEWAFKHGVRFEDGYIVPLSVKEVPLGVLSVIVELEQRKYDYLYIQIIRKPYRGSTV